DARAPVMRPRSVPLAVVAGRGLALAGLALVLTAVSWSLGAREARANGVPVLVDLAYIDLSNWGPQDATGKAELTFAEGIVRIEAQGLPVLDGTDGGDVYQAWLVN